MIPMLAWIANSAPAHLKATYFAVMASFSNLALAGQQLGTVYLNQVFVVKRGRLQRAGVPHDRRHLELAASANGVRAVVDRLRVASSAS